MPEWHGDEAGTSTVPDSSGSGPDEFPVFPRLTLASSPEGGGIIPS